MTLNWNDKPARGYAGADDEWMWGPVQRVDLLWDGIQRRQKHTLASVGVEAAATGGEPCVELGGRGGRPRRPDPPREHVTDDGPDGHEPQVLRRGAVHGADDRGEHGVRDGDLDGKVDAPGAAARWAPAGEARSAPARRALSPRGSSAGSGWWSYVQKDLRTLLGRPVTGPYQTRFCGAGDVARRAASLWATLDVAAAQLAATQGVDPSAWRADATAERIRFAPGILARTMRGSNKPTFQQAITFRSHR